MLMSVVVHDSLLQLGSAAHDALKSGSLGVVLYADDTLLIGVSKAHVQELLNSVSSVGRSFGLLAVNGDYGLETPDGDAIPPSDVMKYLGATIHADGKLKRELNRKLGTARADFQKLHRLWRNTSLTRPRKIAIFQSVVVSRLLYGLGSAWLNVAEVRRLNGFQCRCLRAILGIKPSYVSRVSNARVLEQAGQIQMSRQLLKQQLLLFGRIARAQEGDPTRSLTFVPGCLEPATGRYVRRVGRPRNEWSVMLRKECFKLKADFERIIHLEQEWRRAVHNYCCT